MLTGPDMSLGGPPAANLGFYSFKTAGNRAFHAGKLNAGATLGTLIRTGLLAWQVMFHEVYTTLYATGTSAFSNPGTI